MSRRNRLLVPRSLQRITSRFSDRAWYVTSKAERARYLAFLEAGLERSDWKCIAYSLMYNQIQLAMVAGEQPLEPLLKRVNSPFAHWINRRRGKRGPMFARPVI